MEQLVYIGIPCNEKLKDSIEKMDSGRNTGVIRSGLSAILKISVCRNPLKIGMNKDGGIPGSIA